MKKRKVQISVFYCDSENQKHFLLLKTNKERGSFWQNITGGVEDGETYLEGALRELEEETSIQKQQIKKMTQALLNFEFQSRWHEGKCIEQCFYVELFQKENIKIDPIEHDEFKWLTEKNITADNFLYPSNYALVKEVIEK